MIFALPLPHRGATHIRVRDIVLRRPVDGFIEVRATYGTVDLLSGEFTPDDGLKEYVGILNGEKYTAVVDKATAAGAPEGEFRVEDVLTHLEVL